ncbi:MAG: thermonuclease family protein [Alphaproteobacteria bacterium]|nr:thermonuclease family protein [Alphaproteobacteria bacterium]
MKYLFLAVLLCVAANSALAQVKVVDGDSLEIGDRRIRLDGIDAPELVQTCFTPSGDEYACGKEALNFAEELIKDKPVDCRCLPEKDRYGRELCECFVDDTSLNKTLVQSGWAMSYRDAKYDELQDEAEADKRGIWQGKFMRPALFRALERVTEQK